MDRNRKGGGALVYSEGNAKGVLAETTEGGGGGALVGKGQCV